MWISNGPALISSVVMHVLKVTIALTVQRKNAACKWTFQLHKYIVYHTVYLVSPNFAIHTVFIVFLLTRRLQIAVRLQRTIAGDSARAGVEKGQTLLETSGATTVASHRGYLPMEYIFHQLLCDVDCASVCVWGGEGVFQLLFSSWFCLRYCHVHFLFRCFMAMSITLQSRRRLYIPPSKWGVLFNIYR